MKEEAESNDWMNANWCGETDTNRFEGKCIVRFDRKDLILNYIFK